MIRLSLPAIGDEEFEAVKNVLASGQLVHGEECELFEQELAAYLGCREVVVVSSGTAALHLSLLALEIGPGDAVLVPDFTFPATANVVELAGARPVFVDVDPFTYNVTADLLQEAIANWRGPERLKAVVPVHEFGCPADMTAIIDLAEEHDLVVVEDAACALGAVHKGQKVGTYGQTGCFSFHPRKALTTGEGGAVATNDAALAAELRRLRNHGIQRTPDAVEFVLPGFNYRMTNFQGAMGRVQLRKLDRFIEARRCLQQKYRSELKAFGIHLPQEVPGHVWQTYMVVLPQPYDRNSLIKELRDEGIETNLGAHALHVQPYYGQKYAEEMVILHGNISEFLYQQGLALPLYAGLSDEQLLSVVIALRKVISGGTLC